MSNAKDKSALIDELNAKLAEAHAAQWEVVAQFRDAIDPDAAVRNDFSRQPLIDRVEALRKMEPIAAKVPQLEAEIESLKAGLRALTIIRDECSTETNRWMERALRAEAYVSELRDREHATDKLLDDLGRARWETKCAKDSAALAWHDKTQAMKSLNEWMGRAKELEDKIAALPTTHLHAVNLIAQQDKAWKSVAQERDAWRSRFRVMELVITEIWNRVRGTGGNVAPSNWIEDASRLHAVRQVFYDLVESMKGQKQ